VDPDALQQLVQQLASFQARRDQELAQFDQVDRVIRASMDQVAGIDPVTVKIVQTLAVLRAAEQMSSAAVDELVRVADEQRRA
jgi:hypothetical protein